jgi:putative endonuclease
MSPAFVYILESERDGRFYIGWTSDDPTRMTAHNEGRVKATRYLRPWRLVFVEEHPSATDARKREWQLKRMKSRSYLKALMSSG